MSNIQRQEQWERRQEPARQRWSADWPVRRVARPTAQRTVRMFPAVVISATEEKLTVRAEVPGMRLEDFVISVSGDVLTIQGTRLTGEDLEGGWYHRRERESGGFSRVIALPAEVDGDRADASYQAGVLTVSLPLRQPAKPRQVAIKVAQG